MTKLPEHTETKVGDDVVLVFADLLTAADATLVHEHLAAAHPGASIATGGNQVTVTGVPKRPAARRKA